MLQVKLLTPTSSLSHFFQTFAIRVLEVAQVALVALPAAVVVEARTLPIF